MTENDKKVAFRSRWRIEATLALRAPLVIATGVLEDRERSADGEDRGSTALVERDAWGRPYIPGTSLKGVLRAWCAERFSELEDQIEALFGHEPRKLNGQGEKVPLGGTAEFHDAFVVPDNYCPLRPVSGSTAIDRKTGTAERRKLRHTELAPVGTRFRIRITGDGLDEKDAALLVAALRAFGRDEIRLGGDTGTGRGLGGVEENSIDVRRLEAEQVAAWLDESVPGSWHEWLDADDTKVAVADLDVPDPPAAIRLRLTLAFDGPCLVSEEYPKGRQGDPDRVPTMAGYTGPYLPGSSIKGALRAQAERIAATVGAGEDEDKIEQRVMRLFVPQPREGKSEGGLYRGALVVSDFRPPEGERLIEKQQEFVAIDRFTGGAADQKKFAVKFLDSPCFAGALELRLSAPLWPKASGKEMPREATNRPDRSLTLADFGLLALLLRDLAEGDIRFGYGTTKGYGACRIVAVESDPKGDVNWCLAAILRAVETPGPFPRGTIADARAAFEPWKSVIAQAVKKFLESGGRPADD